MSDEIVEHNNKLIFSIAIISSLIIGFLAAFWVAQDTSGYVASMSFFIIFILFGVPLWIILVIAAIVCFITENYKVYGFALLLSCILLPIFSVTSLKILEATQIANYKKPGVDEMRPIGSELNERSVIAFKENASQDEIHKFDETILRKTVPQPNGVLLEFADGVCGIMYPETEFKYRIADVGFCNDATNEQKKTIKDHINSSSIIYKVFENLQMNDIENLPLEKKEPDNKKQNTAFAPNKIAR